MKLFSTALALCLSLLPFKSFGGGATTPDCGGAMIVSALSVSRLPDVAVQPAQVEAGFYERQCNGFSAPQKGIRINISGAAVLDPADIVVSVSAIMNGKIVSDFKSVELYEAGGVKGTVLLLEEDSVFYQAYLNGSAISLNVKSRSPWSISGRFTIE